MSKELQAVRDLRDVIGWNDEEYNKRLDVIETTLKDYEETDNHLYDLFEKFGINNRKDLLKRLETLEIIKREPSAVIEVITTYDTWKEYTNDYPISDRKIWHIIKNKDEFNLLKKMLL